MTNDLMLGGLYIIMAMVLVLSALMSRREPAAKLITMLLAWVAIFAAGFVLFTFRDDFGWVAQRLKAEAVGTPVEQGRETRVPMAIDGHFWVDAQVNGQSVRFLVDSGATMTTIDRQTAQRVGVEISPRPDQVVRTGNGVIRVSSGRAERLEVGDIVRNDVRLQVAEHDNLNVLGMNFLSSLTRWGVEGRWLVLVP
ncbi:retropepsin-like aspartic protease family protein [Sphingomonas hankyongi]|uniref:TIGR02281 family clan AA aspartic protease n=1 Tax=Sphingomonas hankyongi TaxID=2908209 RepID=A0ABT0S4E9_9SPHN|nr:TIGR02281 family clan AA aspartic protease [Sphingomonas hankyongi]